MPPSPHPSARWRRLAGAVALVACASATTATAAGAPPRADLLVTQPRIVTTAPSPVYGTPALPLVASLVNHGGPVEVEARRAPGQEDWTAQQVIDGVRVPVHAGVLVGPRGLGRAVVVTVLDAGRRVVRHRALTVCLNDLPTRMGPAGPALSSFPAGCALHPFARGLRLGLDTDYGVPIDLKTAVGTTLRPGRYTVRVRMRPATAEWLGMAPADRAVTLGLRALRPPKPPRPVPGVPAAPGGGVVTSDSPFTDSPSIGAPVARRARHRPEPRVAPPPSDVVPPADTLPNLAALPAYGFVIAPEGRRDTLQFAATVWNAGPGPLVVEGYRRSAALRMDAFQFFHRGEDDVAAVPVGRLDYDLRTGHDHWHFRDFARYSLVHADGRRAAISPKEAWCLAPTDQVDQLVPNADPRPGDSSLGSACGDASAVQVREVLEVGAGDTYGTGTQGQAIDVTRLRNGAYLLKIEANPAGVLRETTAADNVSLRRIVLGGTRGRRTVHAAPAEGIDTEGAYRVPRRSAQATLSPPRAPG